MKQIFPKEILENTQEVHYFKHSKKSGIIYNIITLALIATVVLLPFIKITVYSTSQGYIKPLKERVILQTI